MGKTIVFWVLGLYISLFLGGFFTTLFRRLIITSDDQSDADAEKKNRRSGLDFRKSRTSFFHAGGRCQCGRCRNWDDDMAGHEDDHEGILAAERRIIRKGCNELSYHQHGIHGVRPYRRALLQGLNWSSEILS